MVDMKKFAYGNEVFQRKSMNEKKSKTIENSLKNQIVLMKKISIQFLDCVENCNFPFIKSSN